MLHIKKAFGWMCCEGWGALAHNLINFFSVLTRNWLYHSQIRCQYKGNSVVDLNRIEMQVKKSIKVVSHMGLLLNSLVLWKFYTSFLGGNQCCHLMHYWCAHTKPLGIVRFLMTLLNNEIFIGFCFVVFVLIWFWDFNI